LASPLLGASAMRVPPGTLVDHLGHTSFAVERSGRRVLIDPIVARRDLDLRVPACAEWQAGLERVTAVLLSHGHDDHLHTPSLLGLAEDVAVYFLDEPPDTCSCDRDPASLLAALGFRDLHPFQPGDRIPLDGGLCVEAVPAAPSSEGEEQVCFVIETPDVVVLDAVDVRDGAATRAALERRRGNVDVAFLPTGAAVQWQGFWNQMDAVEAVEFSRWLRPTRVASCGGTLSLGERPRPDTLERYPVARAEWLAVAGRSLPPGQLLDTPAPFRLHYEERTLRRVSVLRSAHSLTASPPAAARPQATLAAAFTGYDPLRPTRRACRTAEDVVGWLAALAPVREAIAASPESILALLLRCGLDECRLPAALLAPCTLRFLLRRRADALAGRIAALCPPPVEEPGDLASSFYEVAESLVRGVGLDPQTFTDALSCLWIDRWMFQLFGVHARMRRLADRPAAEAAALREAHLDGLRPSMRLRRPLLGAHHFRLDARGAALLRDAPSAAGRAGLLCFASPDGVQQAWLGGLESLFLDLCDGRTVAEIAHDAGALLDRPPAEIENVLVGFLTSLTRASVLLVDWSAA
jgi:L-ascorbate metabolism protein UlaG (beta-lactamase superfamily)